MTQPFEYKIEFSEDYPKLAYPVFTTIRLDKRTDYYHVKRIYAIYVIGIKRGFAQLESILASKLRDIPLPLIRFDTYEQITIEDFHQKLKLWYSQKPQWHDLETLFLILFLLWVIKL